MLARFYDKILAGVAALLLVVSVSWVFMQGGSMRALEESAPTPVPLHGDYTPPPYEAPSVTTETWPTPVPQKSGSEWVYDVFTPPTIYYDTRTQHFTVTPPEILHRIVASKSDDPSVGFGVQVQEIKVPEYRLQLVGFVGEGPDARGNFENPYTHDTFLAKAGRKLTDLQITIKAIDVRRQTVGGITETVANATIHDERTDEDIVLELNSRRLLEGQVVVVLKADNGDVHQPMSSGESWPVEGFTYTVGALKLSPPQAEITKSGGTLVEPLTLTLTPAGTAAPAPATAPEAAPPTAAPAP